ncbi:MAG: ribosome maturation factor RimM, partial [Thermaurantiacus sp.]
MTPPTPAPPRPELPPSERPVTLAAIAGAHGVSGEVRLKLFAESIESLRRHERFDAGGRTLTLQTLREGPNGPIARFAEIGDRTAAELLRGVALTVPRASLPPLFEGEIYWHDLIGLAVVSPEGAPLGRVMDVTNHGASDILEVERTDGRRVLVPLIA